MRTTSSPHIPLVVQQHAEETALLRNIRTTLVDAPHVKLHHLQRLDERLAAHLDGLVVAGDLGWRTCESALENPAAGEVFAAAVLAIGSRNGPGLDRILRLAELIPESRRGLVAAFEWVDPVWLQGIAAGLLGSSSGFHRILGIRACAAHGADPGMPLTRWIAETNQSVRADALRAAGELGRRDLLSACTSAIKDDYESAAFWASWSAVLLGDRQKAFERLNAFATPEHRSRAYKLVLQAMTTDAAHRLLQSVGRRQEDVSRLIQGSGIGGDPTYVPWLIKHMADDQLARQAGEAFTLITGTDLPLLDLERKPPEDFKSGPSDDPDDPNVDMDPDEGLPWPDAAKVQSWWAGNAARFQAGTRYFVGERVTRAHCLEVMKNGYQRQRILAAHYLCLLEPGTPLFNTSAPALRQQKLLAQMT